MKIIYANSNDDLSEFLNKKVLMHCSIVILFDAEPKDNYNNLIKK